MFVFLFPSFLQSSQRSQLPRIMNPSADRILVKKKVHPSIETFKKFCSKIEMCSLNSGRRKCERRKKTLHQSMRASCRSQSKSNAKMTSILRSHFALASKKKRLGQTGMFVRSLFPLFKTIRSTFHVYPSTTRYIKFPNPL
jgi:hypothetical protein